MKTERERKREKEREKKKRKKLVKGRVSVLMLGKKTNSEVP